MSALMRPSAMGDSNSKTQPGMHGDCEVRHKMRTAAAPDRVFASLTDAEQMMAWLAPDVMSDPRPGGVFRVSDLNGLWIEGVYVEVIPSRKVALSGPRPR